VYCKINNCSVFTFITCVPNCRLNDDRFAGNSLNRTSAVFNTCAHCRVYKSYFIITKSDKFQANYKNLSASGGLHPQTLYLDPAGGLLSPRHTCPCTPTPFVEPTHFKIPGLANAYPGLFVTSVDYSYHGRFVLWTIRTIRKLLTTCWCAWVPQGCLVNANRPNCICSCGMLVGLIFCFRSATPLPRLTPRTKTLLLHYVCIKPLPNKSI